MSRDPSAVCPFCDHFVDWHQGEAFRAEEGPDDDHGWRYRCSCGCRLKMDAEGKLLLVTAGDTTGKRGHA